MATIPTLQPLRFPLTGSHLIEASAGTGKTFTIAMLYVRLVLGHGGELAFAGGALTPPQILVVTFTEAATKELRDRIRARLAEAARCFRGSDDSSAMLCDLRADYPEDRWPACARKLELAAEWMDEAAVSTIHGWCNRMLREHAFDSQSLFTQQLETDQSELRADIVRDYWRNHFYPLPADQIGEVCAWWGEPGGLEKALYGLLDHADRLPNPADPATLFAKANAEKAALLAELKAPWPIWVNELRQLFAEAVARKAYNGNKLRAKSLESWLEAIETWAGSPLQDQLNIPGSGWDRLTPDGIADAWKGDPPAHPAFDAIPELRAALARLPSPQKDILAHAARWIAHAFAAAQKRRAQMGFDDLLTGLDAALAGDQGERLATTIRRQFPVALIDEFQDTDPVQYRIFERIYLASTRDATGLILIGDPKQAIYAFRGADIHTYLKARQAVDGRLYTLGTNFRSTAAMVAAANHCFLHAERRDGPGAFLFRSQAADPVPFQPVEAQGRADDFLIDGRTPPAMTLAVLAADEAISKGAYTSHLADACATQVVAWLNRGQAGTACFAGPEGSRSVRPGDIAILVNNGREAGALRDALSRRGVRSVYLSDNDSVYASPQATEVYRWLAAGAEPDNDRLLRAALSSPSLGLGFAELDRLNHDEQAWEERVIQFKGYREIWQKQGVLPMLRRILLDFECSERLLGQQGAEHGGERILTDILHLAELLQQASHAIEGEHALIRYLAEQQEAPEGDAEGRKLRLESDADLVRVITVHKSKGLEYPLVCIPFAAATRLIKANDVPLKWHDDRGELRISLDASPQALDRAQHEHLGENLRKTYVALTRARYHTWLGLAPIANNDPNAIGSLFGLDGIPAAGYLDAVREFAAGQPAIEVLADPPVSDARYRAETDATPVGQARRPNRVAREDWRISSYSGLRIEGHALPAPAGNDDTAQAETLAEAAREARPADAAERPREPMHRFHKGAEPGTFLHELMEWVADAGFSTALADPAALHVAIAQRCALRGWDDWAAPLAAWVRQMLTTPLPVGCPLRLEQLASYRSEMEFWFAATDVDLAALDAAVTRLTLAGRPRPRLTADRLNGMLKGFMDLVFEYEGRYFVADYKSNWLGPDDAAYTTTAMDAAIREHRYDLQYALYLFALHRLLRQRLPDYDYDRHIGGAVYLFVRGIGAPGAGVHFERPPRELMDILDDLFTGRTRRAA